MREVEAIKCRGSQCRYKRSPKEDLQGPGSTTGLESWAKRWSSCYKYEVRIIQRRGVEAELWDSFYAKKYLFSRC